MDRDALDRPFGTVLVPFIIRDPERETHGVDHAVLHLSSQQLNVRILSVELGFNPKSALVLREFHVLAGPGDRHSRPAITMIDQQLHVWVFVQSALERAAFDRFGEETHLVRVLRHARVPGEPQNAVRGLTQLDFLNRAVTPLGMLLKHLDLALPPFGVTRTVVALGRLVTLHRALQAGEVI